MDTSSVSNVGPLAQSIQLEAAQVRMARKQMDAQGEAALQLIQSVAPMNVDSNVGRSLNIVA
jgi:hypothetical protein